MIIPILMLLFGLGGTTFGMSDELVPFYLLIMPIIFAMGYETIYGCSRILRGLNMSKYKVNILGFGDNVVDQYEHLKTMYPGGNCVNVCAYALRFGAERSAYMGYFGNDRNAEYVISILEKIGIEMQKCKQLEGENGWARVNLVDGDRVFIGWNDGGIRGKTPYVLDRFDIEYIKQFDVVHSGNYCFTEDELPKIKNAGVKVSFDFSDDSTEEYYSRILPYVDYAFCSFDGDEEALKKHLQMVIDGGATFIIVPQATKNILPAMGNEFIQLIKETSILGYVGILDLTKASSYVSSRTYQMFIPLAAAGLMYYLIVKGLSILLGRFERSLKKSD